MTKSFANFVQENPKSQYEQQKFDQINQTKKNNNDKENIEKIVNQFHGKSQDELLETLHNEVQKQKHNGTFDIQKLNQSIEMLSPFLSESQKQNIKELLKQI